MIVLHAGLLEGGALGFWAERDDETPATLPPLAGQAVEVVARLPARAGKVVPSTPLLLPPGATLDEPDGLSREELSALRVSVGTALPFLARARGQRTLGPGVLVGHDLAFWAEAARLALALVARHRFLPGVKPGRATWDALPSDSERELLASLAKAMPDACRAFSPGDRPRAALLAEFLDAAVDHFVRANAPPEPRPAAESLHDRWVDALLGDGNLDDASALAPAVAEWRRPLELLARAPFRVGFRLEEPEERSEAFQLVYLLRSTQDPSLVLGAEAVWHPRPGERLLGDPRRARETLLAALGRAARVSPTIDASLERGQPSRATLSVLEAHDFLVNEAGALEQAGFFVLLPSWWTARGTRLRLGARVRATTPRRARAESLSLDALASVKWEVALGDETLSRDELLRLAELKTPLVRVRGQWVLVGQKEIDEALALLKRKGGKASLFDLIRVELGAAPDEGSLPVEGVAATGWVRELLDRFRGKTSFEELPQPARFRGTLRPYQVRGTSWLHFHARLGLGACLADDMGLGKSAQALALVQRLRDEGERAPVLLVAPTSVLGNWKKETERFTPELPFLLHHGPTRAKGPAFAKEAKKHALVATSYALAVRDLAALSAVEWAGVILDEAQNVKNAHAKQARAVRSLTTRFRIALTGTPVENDAGDLHAIFEFLNPGLLGTERLFRETFLLPIARGDDAATGRLQKITQPFLLRRVKTDPTVIQDLPPKVESRVFATLTREQASLYEAVVTEGLREIDDSEGIERRGRVLAALARLKQVCNHPAHFLKESGPLAGRSGKLARLTEMLEEVVASGERALVFTQFKEMGDLLVRHLRAALARDVAFLHGGTPRTARDRLIESFQKDEDGPPVFVLSLKAGGTGLNLTRASHVFHFDRWWNPAVEDQATDRAFRIGQTRRVVVSKFVCAGTVEERIDALLEKKRALRERLIGTGEKWLTELSTDELRGLLALDRDAVEEP